MTETDMVLILKESMWNNKKSTMGLTSFVMYSLKKLKNNLFERIAWDVHFGYCPAIRSGGNFGVTS